jgi:hypothetical protein
MTVAVAADRKAEVLHYAQALCESLEADYRLHTVKSYQQSLRRVHELKSLDGGYIESQLEAIRNGTYDYKFEVSIEEGKKYLKVVIRTHGSGSVHCFVDKNTGEVYKSASWKSPAKGVRYNLLDATSRDLCYRSADWAGSYLYLRG